MRPLRLHFLDHPAHLGDFFHQVQLGGQAAGGVSQDDVDAARLGGGDGVEDDRRRVAAVLGDDRHVVAFTPGLQLLPRCRPEGIAGSQQNALALILEILGQLADGGGLAGPVDAGDHDDERFVGADIQRLFEGLENIEEGIGQSLLDAFRRIQLVAFGAGLEIIEQILGRFDAHIAGQEQGFQVFQQFVVNLAPGEQGLEFAAPLSAGLAQPLEQALAPGGLHRRIGSRHAGFGGIFFQETEHVGAGLRGY